MIYGKTILITGGAGAIGSNLAKVLDHRNKVIIIDDLSSGYHSNIDGLKNTTIIKGDLLEEYFLDQAFSFVPQVVFHLAAFFANQNSVDHPERDLMVNGMGTLKVLQKSLFHNVEKFLYISSSCVYGHKESKMKEDDIGKLHTPYAITKLLGEQYTQYYNSYYELNTTILRLFNCYGPGEYPGQYRNVIPNFFWSAINGKSLTITGTGKQKRTFTYVGDVVDALVKTIDAAKTNGEIINIGSAKETSITKLVELINRITDNNAEISFVPQRQWDIVHRRQSCVKKAQKLLNWKATTPLIEGLEKYYQWIENKDLTKIFYE